MVVNGGIRDHQNFNIPPGVVVEVGKGGGLKGQNKLTPAGETIPNLLLQKPYTGESFQLQMGFSFSFLCANDSRSFLLNIIARSFLRSCT